MNRSRISSIITITVLIILVVFFLGCSSSSNDTPYDLTSGTATIFGRALVEEQPLEGSRVSLISAAGIEIPLENTPVVDQGGFFAMHLKMLPSGSFTIFVNTTDGLTFTNEIENFTANETVYVNPVTTIEYAYRQSHPEFSISEVHNKVWAHLGVRAYSYTGDELLNSHYSRFSAKNFMDTANAYPGGFNEYINSLVNMVHLGAPGLPPIPEDPLEDVLAENEDVAELWYELHSASKLPQEVVEKEVAKEFSLITAIGDGLVDNLIGIVLNSFIPGPDSAALAEIQKQLTLIENMLVAIDQELSNMLADINTQFTRADYISCANSMKNQANDIEAAYEYLNRASSFSVQKDLTDFQTQIVNLNQYTYQGIYNDAILIHKTQFSPDDPNVPSLVTLAKELNGSDNYLSDKTFQSLKSQQNYYAGLQLQAISLISALASPSDYIFPQPPVHANSPAGVRNDANLNLETVSNNISAELVSMPYPLLDKTQALDIHNNNLFQNASVLNSTGGTTYNYALNLASGGLKGWTIADTNSISALFDQVSGAPSSYSQALSGFGFNLKPGPVTYSEQYQDKNSHWYSMGTKTATNNGFLTITQTSPGNYTVGWIDDSGKTGAIGTFSGTDIAGNLDSDRDVYIGKQFENIDAGWFYYYGGHINGPCIIMFVKDSGGDGPFAFQSQSFAPVALGYYNGFNISLDRSQYVDMQSQSLTQQLYAIPKFTVWVPGSFINYQLCNTVYWTSSDPVNAPISNVPPWPVSSGNPEPVAQFTTPQTNSGVIHWMKGASGHAVTFTASRTMPDGTVVSGSTILTGPDINTITINDQPLTPVDSIDVYPSMYSIYSDNLMNTGVQLYVTRHNLFGRFEDVSGAVAYSSSDSRVSVSAGGRVKASSIIPPGMEVDITATDNSGNMEWTQSINKRKSVTCTINVQ